MVDPISPNLSPIEKDKDISANSLLRKLIKIFRTNSATNLHIQGVGPNNRPVGTAKSFFKNNYGLQSIVPQMSIYDRYARYSDYMEMESNPIISKALDIYADETTQKDEDGKIIKIISEDKEIKDVLTKLYDETLHLNGKEIYKLVRYLCKYGDVFYLIDATEEDGVVGLILIPANEVEREEGYDKDEPSAVRFRWATRSNVEIPNAYVAHFRLDGIDQFIPFGQSVLESARRPWRQIVLMEDHMLAYRVIRTPERRVYYLDMMGVPPENEEEVVAKFNTLLKKNKVIGDNGQLDLRFGAAQTVEEDIIVAVRGGDSGTRIETLPGGANTQEIDDIEYIRKNLFAALGVPKAFLTFDDGVGSKQTLSMEDVRFARTISRIQEAVLHELVKISLIHLFLKGYQGEKLMDFKIRMTNPSTMAELQKNELWRSRMDLVQSAGDGVFDTTFIYKNFLHLSDEAIDLIRKGQIQDKIFQAKLLQIESQSGISGGGSNMMGAMGAMGGGGMGTFGGNSSGAPLGGAGLISNMGAAGGALPNMGGGMPESLNPAAKTFDAAGGKDLTRLSANERVAEKRGHPEEEIFTIKDVEDSVSKMVDMDGQRRTISSPFGMEEGMKLFEKDLKYLSNESKKMLSSHLTKLFESISISKPTTVSAGQCTSINENMLLEQFGKRTKFSSTKKILTENQSEEDEIFEQMNNSWNSIIEDIDITFD